MVCCQGPGLTLHIPSLHHVRNNLASAVALWLLPGKTHLTVSGVSHLEALHRSGHVWEKTQPVTEERLISTQQENNIIIRFLREVKIATGPLALAQRQNIEGIQYAG
jgi:hypothetical protein